MPWEPWGETDVLLTSALDLVERQEAATCSCCGHLREEAHDPGTEGRWQVVVVKCFAGAALRDFREKHGEEIGDDMVGLHLLPDGETATDPLEYDPVAARREYEDQQRRLGGSAEPGQLVSVRRVTAQEQRDRPLDPPRAGG